MASQVNGDEPYDYRFYGGEWVAVLNDTVVKHGDAPEDLIEYAQRNQLAGTNIFLVKKELLPEVLWM